MTIEQARSVFGVQAAASQDDIRTAYRELAKVWHPDRFANESESLKLRAREQMALINRAYQLLTHPSPRGNTGSSNAGPTMEAESFTFSWGGQTVTAEGNQRSTPPPSNSAPPPPSGQYAYPPQQPSKQPRWLNKFLLVIGIVLAVGALNLVFRKSSTSESSSASERPSTATPRASANPSARPKAETARYAVGQEFGIGQWTIAVDGFIWADHVNRPANPGVSIEYPNGSFVFVSVVVRNDGSSASALQPFYLMDNAGRKYNEVPPERFKPIVLRPGVLAFVFAPMHPRSSQYGYVVFDVPCDKQYVLVVPAAGQAASVRLYSSETKEEWASKLQPRNTLIPNRYEPYEPDERYRQTTVCKKEPGVVSSASPAEDATNVRVPPKGNPTNQSSPPFTGGEIRNGGGDSRPLLPTPPPLLGSSNGPTLVPGSGGGADGRVYSVGDGVTPPSIISKVEPEYSEAGRAAKLNGSVTLSLVVNTDGTAEDIRIVKSLGMGLDEKAIEALQRWRFKPGMNNGVPVKVRMQVDFSFRML
jgi:TonB family protein